MIFSEEDQMWHMFAAEMVGHCGIDSWMENSRIVHAVSKTPHGLFNRTGVVVPPFAHEPDIIRDEKGGYVLFFTQASKPETGDRKPCVCADGSTDHATCAGAKYQWDRDPTYFVTASSPWGPWSSNRTMVLEPEPEVDNNFAAVILNNGSLVGFKRRYVTSPEPPAVGNGSRIHLVTAAHWRDPSSYVVHADELFPSMPNIGVEDPDLYFDSNGNFHAVLHNMQPCPDWPCPEVAGGHAYSEDGINWFYSGVAFGGSGEFTDGHPFSFSRRERPHVIQDPTTKELLAVTNGVQYGMQFGDAVYTFLQPIQTATNQT